MLLVAASGLWAQNSSFRIPSLTWMLPDNSPLWNVPTGVPNLRIVYIPYAPRSIVRTSNGVPVSWVGRPPSVGVGDGTAVARQVTITHTNVVTVVNGQVVNTTVVGYQGGIAPVVSPTGPIMVPLPPPIHR